MFVMLREIAITIYLFFCRVLFLFFKLFRIHDRHVFVASFPENTSYMVDVLAENGDKEIHILCTFPADKLKLPPIGSFHVSEFSLRSPVKWLAGMKLIATSRTVFVDNYFGWLAAKPFRSGVRCVQLWHAAGAIKRFGLKDSSIENRSVRAHRRFRKVYETFTHIVCGSEKMAEIFKSAFGVSDDRIVRTGVPRTDFFFNEERLLESELKVKNALDLPDRKVILYAPTYRDEELHVSRVPLDLKAMEEALGLTHILLLKLHPAVEVDFELGKDGFVRDVSDYPDINELLSAADVLISDYSSIPFEFALLEKPMIFYAYDLVEYEESRGFWEDYNSLVPGPVVAMTEEIIREIQEDAFDLEKVSRFSAEWNAYSNGRSSIQLAEALDKEKQQSAGHP